MRLLAAVTTMALQASVLAAGPSSVPEHPWTLRGEFTINTPMDPLPGDAALTATLARRVASHVAVEATLGPGLSSTMRARGTNGAERDVDVASGLHGALLLRVDRRLGASGRSGLSLAAGPSFVSGDAFGTVPMARAEAGFDLRFKRRFVFFYGLGYETALKTSRLPIAASDCIVSDCPLQYRSGKGQVTSRVGLGLTF